MSCAWKLFSPVFCLLASAGWRKTILISVRSTGPRPLVLNRAGLTSAAATEPDCWTGDRWVGVVYRPWLNRAGLHLFGVMCCYRAGNSGMSLTWFRAESSGRHVILQKDIATKLSNWEAMSSSWSAPHIRYSGKKSFGLEVRLVLAYLQDSFKCHYILTSTICCPSPTDCNNLSVNALLNMLSRLFTGERAMHFSVP